MASIEEVWGSPFPTRRPLTKGGVEPTRDAAKEGRVYRSPQERTQASVFTHKKTIDDLSKTLPIVQTDEEAGRNYRPERSRVRESFTTATEYPYAPPSFQPPVNDDKLNRILHMIEQNRTGYQTASTQDMLLYIATGVFFLFAMDTFVSLGKRMK
jgi:hypothetical protein